MLQRVDGLWIRPDVDGLDMSVIEEQRIDVYRLGLRDLAGAIVVDVGANIGAVSVACARAGAARVIAIEPENANLELLHLNAVEWPAIEVYECALGDTAGRCDMLGSSTRARMVLGESVTLMTLPGLLDSLNITDIGVLKMDIEGAEYDVLRATPCTVLRQIDYLALELHGPPLCPWVASDKYRWDVVRRLSVTHEVEMMGMLPGLSMLWAKRRD